LEGNKYSYTAFINESLNSWR